ncbi:unnamed protein product [Clonostachys chloroleuca]|uniref:Uncharacterized protein n=1 Tax=Clonostachys chloroleuca TaxID=1926264 RepID=A0AA35MES6_9HYPO|nr:unnamed protein product [Clonostachys chloroleuca]
MAFVIMGHDTATMAIVVSIIEHTPRPERSGGCRDGLESYATRQEAEQRRSSVDTAIKVLRAWVFPGGWVEVQSDHNQVEIVIVPQLNSLYVIEPKA